MGANRCDRLRVPLSPVLFGVALVVSLAVAPAARSASGAIVHCMSRDGSSLYTDRPCAFAGARPAPMSGALLARLTSDARLARDQGLEASLPIGVGDVMPSTVPRRPAAEGCARSPRQLAADVRGSLALGDVNRLAESYHWVGMHTREGRRTLERLGHLLGHQAVDSQYYAAQLASLSDDDTRGGDGGILQVVLSGRG
jgi:hypothetical protein